MNEQLQLLYPPEEIRSFARIIFDKVCGLSYNQQILCKDNEIPDNEKNRIYKIVNRLKKMEPLQYILGETEFYGIPLKVNPSVMIPRPETEELVNLIIKSPFVKSRSKREGLFILDVGTGSGCIAIALAKHLPGSLVVGADISLDALQVAGENALQNNVQVRLMQEDILNTNRAMKQIPCIYDLLVSNPPYIKDNEKSSMSANVVGYEPHQALFVPSENPIIFYEAIATFALSKLMPGGIMFFEINPQCSKLILNMLHKKGFSRSKIIRDLSGKDRFISTYK